MKSGPQGFDPTERDITAKRRRVNGTRTTWLLQDAGDSTRVTRWDRDKGDSGWSPPAIAEYASIGSALAGESDLHSLRADERTSYRAPEIDSLLPHLRVVDPEAEPDDFDWHGVSDYEDEDDVFLGRKGLVSRYARANGRRVHFADCGGGRYLAFLCEDGDAVGAQLAEFRWGSEAGMASGAGGFTLTRTSDQCAVALATGDTVEWDGGRGFVQAPGPAGTARMISDWITYIEDSCLGVFGTAALALEPLDPSHKLRRARRAEWQSELDYLGGGSGETMCMTFSVDAEVVSPLRAVLATNGTYRSVAAALADPIEGDWLRVALSEGDLDPLR